MTITVNGVLAGASSMLLLWSLGVLLLPAGVTWPMNLIGSLAVIVLLVRVQTLKRRAKQ